MNAMTITETKPMATETSSRAYYVVKPSDLMPGPIAEVMFGVYPEKDDGEVALAEMAFRWFQYSNRTHCRLEVFDESWAALSRMPDVFAALGTLVAQPDPGKPWLQPASPTVEKIVETLESLGFVDIDTRKARA